MKAWGDTCHRLKSEKSYSCVTCHEASLHSCNNDVPGMLEQQLWPPALKTIYIVLFSAGFWALVGLDRSPHPLQVSPSLVGARMR